MRPEAGVLDPSLSLPISTLGVGKCVQSGSLVIEQVREMVACDSHTDNDKVRGEACGGGRCYLFHLIRDNDKILAKEGKA